MAVHIIAVLFPKADKVDRLVELLGGMATWVEANEPGTLKYEVNRETNKKTGVQEVVMLESYKDMDAVKAHGASEKFKAFNAQVVKEGLTDQKMQLKFVQPVGGFASRL